MTGFEAGDSRRFVTELPYIIHTIPLLLIIFTGDFSFSSPWLLVHLLQPTVAGPEPRGRRWLSGRAGPEPLQQGEAVQPGTETGGMLRGGFQKWGYPQMDGYKGKSH